jgi:CubicO group peptidase (beta-lactamase class C family)
MMTALLMAFCFAACNATAGEIDNKNPPEIPWPTKSWQVSTPEEQGMDSASLARLIESVGTYKQDSLMIIRHGKIVAEAYYAPYLAGISHDLRSVTKSVVGTLTAIQLTKGSLDTVDRSRICFPTSQFRMSTTEKRR